MFFDFGDFYALDSALISAFLKTIHMVLCCMMRGTNIGSLLSIALRTGEDLASFKTLFVCRMPLKLGDVHND
jgi:hypothetical protein